MNLELLNINIILENSRIELIPFDNERNQELKEIIFDDSIWKYMGMCIRDQVDFDNYIENTVKQAKLGLCIPFLVIDKQTNKIAGSTRYGFIDHSNQKCEIGWTWYGKRFQGTGINKACKFELLNFGFENVGFRRICFGVDRENIRSQKAVAKLGAKKEGVLRNNLIDSKGKSRDEVYFSIIQEEWPEIRSSIFDEFTAKTSPAGASVHACALISSLSAKTNRAMPHKS